MMCFVLTPVTNDTTRSLLPWAYTFLCRKHSDELYFRQDIQGVQHQEQVVPVSEGVCKTHFPIIPAGSSSPGEVPAAGLTPGIEFSNRLKSGDFIQDPDHWLAWGIILINDDTVMDHGKIYICKLPLRTGTTCS